MDKIVLSKKDTILFISPFDFKKRNFGAAVRSYYFFKSLKKRARIFSIVLGKHKNVEADFIEIPCNRKLFPISPIKTFIQIRKLAKKYKPKLICLSTTNPHCALITILIKIFTNFCVVLDAHNVEFMVQKFKRGFLPCLLTYIFEKFAFKLSDFIISASPKDKIIIETISDKKVFLVPNGVDLRMFKRSEPIGPRRKYLLVFHGLMSYFPNKDAIARLKLIISKLRKINPKISLLIFGGGSEKIKFKGAESLGLVPFEQIPTILKSCDAAVVPIFYGSGSRIKIVEYMAAGLPIIASSKAVEGLDLKEGEHYLQAENVEEFVEKTLLILKDKKIKDQLAKNAARLAEKYDWDKSYDQVLNMLFKRM